MIRSMTAFIRQEIQEKNWHATWEIRSFNQRYLELHIYLPDTVRNLETDIRKTLTNTNRISRGRIECKLHINNNDHNSIESHSMSLNTKLLEKLFELIKQIPGKNNIDNIDPIKILSWPGVLTLKQNNINALYPKLIQSFNETLYKFINVRENEGKCLKKIINKRLSAINHEINNIKQKIPSVILHHKQKILKKIQELNIHTINNNRLEEELFNYIQRSDISEEIDRLEIHINNVNQILSQDNIVGRKLDFIMQELYREINTLAAKSVNTSITQSSIEIKVLIDQIREQIQNIE